MHFDSFEDFQHKIQASYAMGEFSAALQLANIARHAFPEHAQLIDYWRIAMSARTGDNLQALNLFEQVLQSGFWYGETLLRKSPSFVSLQGLPAFEVFVERNNKMRQLEQEALYPLLVLRSEGRCLGDGPSCPLMIALHANAGTAHDSVAFWQPAAQSGWLVAAPQSDQAMWKGAYVWDSTTRPCLRLTPATHSRSFWPVTRWAGKWRPGWRSPAASRLRASWLLARPGR
jgi:hypothetical protein